MLREASARTYKCVVVGNNGVGKSSLLRTHIMGCSSQESIFLEDVRSTITVGENQVKLALWDTWDWDGDHYTKLRWVAYRDADVFILCFSMVCEVSYQRIYSTWFPEVNSCAPHTPILLVGTKQVIM